MSTYEEQAEAEIHEKAALGVAYQKAIATLRPADVYERLHRMHRYIARLEEKIIGKTGVHALTELEFELRAFCTGRDRESFR